MGVWESTQDTSANHSMADKLIGSYQFEKNDNFDEFLTATGVPFVAKKVMLSTSPSLEVKQEGDNKWSFTFKVLLKTNTISFEFGKEFTEENPVLGDSNKCVAEIVDGNIVIKTEHLKSGTKATRTFVPTDEGLTLNLASIDTDFTARRY